ncbi:MAG: nicotinamidase-like amidase [Actinomycetia bacterium]|nr:nicotinamidase-like amidase [Actinomycetes bacterium]
MPLDFGDLVAPAHTAVVTCEMQRGVIGDLACVPDLAEEVADLGVIGAAAALVGDARAAGVRVVHATVELRGDRAGLSINNRMMAYVTKNPDQVLQGSPFAELLPELGPEPEDIVCRRIHGLTPFTGTELDSILRNLGIRTIVPVGVSVNEALLGLCISAADLGYRIALPTDAIAGIPRSYTEDVLKHTLAMLAHLTTTEAVRAAWKA